MENRDICRRCHNPAKDFATNMMCDNYNGWYRCPRCVDVQRVVDQQRTEWNQRVVHFVRKLSPELQDYYRYDFEHGTLRAFMSNLRENGKSPEEAIRAWRYKVMYIDATQTRRNHSPPVRHHSTSTQFQTRYDAVPQRQYKRPSEMPVLVSPPMELVVRPPLPVLYTPPTQVVSNINGLHRTYFPDTMDDDVSDTSSESSNGSFHGHANGVVKDRHGKMAVVVTDSRGRRARGHSVLAYFVT